MWDTLTELDLLNEYLEQELNRIHAYSDDYRMTTPKRGYEREFEDAEIKVYLLREIIRKM